MFNVGEMGHGPGQSTPELQQLLHTIIHVIIDS